MIDNFNFDPLSFYYACDDVNNLLSDNDELLLMVKSLNEYTASLGNDLNYLNPILTDLNSRLVEFNEKCQKTKNMLENMDDSIFALYEYLGGHENQYESYYQESFEEKIRKLKGNNSEVGGLVSKNSQSLFDIVRDDPNILIDSLKGNNNELGGNLTLNAQGLLDKVRNNPVAVIDGLKGNNSNIGGVLSNNVESIMINS